MTAGKTEVKKNETANVKVTNTYTYSATGNITFEGVKTLEGRAMTANDVFTFEIAENNTTKTWSVSNDATGKINYPTISYTLADVGEHTYTVKETSTSGNGITVSDATYSVTVNVSDNDDGTLNVVPSDNAKKLDFINTYDAKASITFEGVKSIDGRALMADDVFTFQIAETGTDKTWPATNDATGKITYPTISYTLADVGEHNYTVKETSTGGNGITVDTRSYTVRVTVTDDGKGNLNVAASDNAKALSFVNTYNAVGEITFEGAKTLEGRALTAGDVFDFEVLDKQTGTATTVHNDATGKINYPTIQYTLADAGKTFTYEVRESSPDTDRLLADATRYTVTVTVTDNGDGTLNAVASDNAKALSFVNTLKTGNLAVKKTVEQASEAVKDKAFHFVVKLDDATINGTYGTGATAMTFKNGVAEFELKDGESRIATGLPAMMGYTVTEDKYDGFDTHASNDKSVIDYNNTKTAEFRNVYRVQDNETVLNVSKKLVGRNFVAGDQWTFTVTAEEGTPMPQQTSVVFRPDSGSKAPVNFGVIRFTQKDIGKTYTYTITETGNVDLVKNDTANPKTVTVTVNDDGKGGLLITNSSAENEVVFTNTFETLVKVNKVDVADGKELEGAKIEIIDKDGKVVDTWIPRRTRSTR